MRWAPLLAAAVNTIGANSADCRVVLRAAAVKFNKQSRAVMTEPANVALNGCHLNEQ